MAIAQVVSTRASCPRAACGAVIVGANRRILGTGYNGAQTGQPHCLDEGCIIEDGHCQRPLHAEVNAIVHSTKPLEGATIYVYGHRGVCRECTKVIEAARIERVVHAAE